MGQFFLRAAAAAGISLASLLFGCSQAGPITAITTTTTPVTTPTACTSVPIATTAKAKFAYTGNQGASLSGYSVNTATGALTPLSGFPIAFGLNPTAVAHDPQNRFLIVADIAADQLHVLAINASTGSLREISPSPYAVPAAPNSPYNVAEPVSVTVDPSGTHVYMVNQGSSQIEAYNLSSTGVLTPVAGAPFYTGDAGPNFSIGSNSILVDAAGTALYVQDYYNVYTFSIAASSGTLTLLQTIPGPSAGNGIALDPAGTYLYAVGAGTDSILTYGINATSGSLTLVKSSPMAEPNGAYTIAISPTGQFAYTIENNNYLVSYELCNGAFTQIGSARPGYFGLQIGIDPSGAFLYVPDTCSGSGCQGLLTNSVSEFSITASGSLTLITGSPVAAGTSPFGITITTQ